jgi:hypothetical protein
MIMKNIFDYAASGRGHRVPVCAPFPTAATRHWSHRRRLVRGEVRWPVTGEAAVMPGATGRGGPLHRKRAA